MLEFRQSETHYSIHMSCAWRDDRRNQRTFTSVCSHSPPRDSVIVAGGDTVSVGEVPVSVELVIFTIADRLVTRHRHRITRQLLKIHFRPVEVVLHGRIRLLIERHPDMEVRPLQNDIVPRIWFAPSKFETTLLAIDRFIPSSTA